MTSAQITVGAVQAGQRNSNAPTLILVAGLAVTWLALPSEDAESLFRTAAIGVGIALVLSTAMEALQGVRALIRTDNLMLWVLYGLTLLEFHFPQPDVNAAVSVEAATRGATAVLLGFFGMSVGRHLVSQTVSSSAPIDLKPAHLFGLFVIAFVLGYLHIFLAVSFNPVEMIEQMLRPRFSQSWGRGKYGNIYSLFYELSLLIYLLPPIAGMIFGQASRFSAAQKLFVVLVLALTIFYAFTSGTRNILGTYIISMFGAYVLSKPNLKLKQVLMVGVPLAGLLLFASTLMLEFRSAGSVTAIGSEERRFNTLYIDHNIVNISNLTNIFPDAVAYLGFEIPYQAIIKPIPRALWSGKPEGLSTSIEAALGMNDGVTTLSCTFVGEAYMAAGLLGVLVAGLAFGAAAGAWNRIGRQSGSSFFQILYASGFLCAAMAMRSLITMVPYMLPSLAFWLLGKYWLPKSKN